MAISARLDLLHILSYKKYDRKMSYKITLNFINLITYIMHLIIYKNDDQGKILD